MIRQYVMYRCKKSVTNKTTTEPAKYDQLSIATQIKNIKKHQETVVMSDKEPVRGGLEDDDEFEDFPVDSWPTQPVSQGVSSETNLWAEDWDDIEVENEFTRELKSELEKQKE